MAAQKHGKRFPVRTIGLAVVLILLAGAVAVYVNRAPSGNTPDQAAVAVSDCSAAGDLARRIEPLAVGDIAAMGVVDAPMSLSGLAFDGPDGTRMRLGDLGGKTLLVNLWATWCVPCREEMPTLDSLQAELGGDDFEVVAINIDTGGDEKPKTFLDGIGIQDLAFYRDSTMGVFNELKKQGHAVGLPATLLIDENGCPVSRMFGPADWSGDDAKAYLRAAMAPQGEV